MNPRPFVREHQFKRNLKKACPIKVRHRDWFSAFAHCRWIEQKSDSQNPITIYHCDLCGFAHVGHLAAGESNLMYGAYSENVRKLQRKTA